ncbi:hypothetical protein R1flu_011376 [Riccia fluitans]|uniref:Uncharacterized protein n=1 Tax=Riccia fluitans TaxID=41844 RepID=A0ABD1ZA64_9MARC
MEHAWSYHKRTTFRSEAACTSTFPTTRSRYQPWITKSSTSNIATKVRSCSQQAGDLQRQGGGLVHSRRSANSNLSAIRKAQRELRPSSYPFLLSQFANRGRWRAGFFLNKGGKNKCGDNAHAYHTTAVVSDLGSASLSLIKGLPTVPLENRCYIGIRTQLDSLPGVLPAGHSSSDPP